MYDIERVNTVIEEIKGYLLELKQIDLKNNDKIQFYAGSMIAFTIINKTIDLAEIIVKSKNLGYPLQYKEYFKFIRQAKIIDKKMEDNLVDLIIFRNKISHRYGDIGEKDIIKISGKINMIEDFIQAIIKETKNKK